MSQVLLAAASLLWIAPTDSRFDIHGAPWLKENQGELIRLPRRLRDEIPKAVWNLGESPSGLRIRFRTDSTSLAIRLSYLSPPNMTNMHAFGQTGVDLYVDGVYRSTAIAPRDAKEEMPVEHVYFQNLPRQEREITLYLPLYKPVKVLGVGLDPDAKFSKARRFVTAKPVVFYGTSITQGGCASRSGMSYQAILSRQLHLDFVNLGFSGNGRGEPAVARMVAEIDASAFVVDFSQNNPTVESLRAVYEPFLTTVREKHPKTPIIAVTAIAASRETPRLEQMREHVREVVKRRIAQGDRLLTLVEGPSLLSRDRLDGLVDGTHPNDLGFQWMADGLAVHIAKALELPPPVVVNDLALTTNLEAANSKRAQIIRFIWGAQGLPRHQPASIQKNVPSPIPGLKNAAGVETFTIRMEAGQENTTHHFQPRRSNGRLVVLHQGHACTFDDAQDPRGPGMANAVDAFLGEGYAVLAAYMPHMRPGDCRTLPHARMFDLAVSSGHPLKFFLEPVAVSLNALKPRYKEIHMAGLSGGGWTTTLYAAIDPQVRASFPVAGTVPLQWRNRNTVGDKEQHLEEFYRLANYLDLYLLGSWGAGRKQIQILNRRDDCCFGEAQHRMQAGMDYETAIREYEKQIQRAAGSQGRFRVDIDDAATHHMISTEAVKTILREMASSPQ
jgi:lysophospholipase L1-like esterase